MKKFRDNKKIQFMILKITAMCLIIFVFASCSRYAPEIIPQDSIILYSKDELIEAYWRYKDELNEVAEIVLNSNSFRQRIIDGKEGDWDICSDYVKGDFSEEEWGSIVDLFEKIRPYMLMRSLREGNNVFYINFGQRKVNGDWISNSLYYFKTDKAVDDFSKYSWVGELEHIDGYWYVDEFVSK